MAHVSGRDGPEVNQWLQAWPLVADWEVMGTAGWRRTHSHLSINPTSRSTQPDATTQPDEMTLETPQGPFGIA